MSHISDTQFQELLDGNLNERQLKLYLKHIWDCPICKQEWQTYLQIKKQLAQDLDIQLSNQFADHVLAALPNSPLYQKIRKWIYIISSLGILAVIGTLLYFRAAIKQVFMNNAGFESPLVQFHSIFRAMDDFISRVAGDQFGFFIIACLALILIGVLDKKIIQPRMKRSFQLLNGTL